MILKANDSGCLAWLRRFPAKTRAEEPRASGIQVSNGSARSMLWLEPNLPSTTPSDTLTGEYPALSLSRVRGWVCGRDKISRDWYSFNHGNSCMISGYSIIKSTERVPLRKRLKASRVPSNHLEGPTWLRRVRPASSTEVK